MEEVPQPKLGLKSILVPTDFSTPSRKALEYAIPFAEQFGARITLLFVAESPIRPSDLGFLPPFMENDAVLASSREALAELARQTVKPELLEKVLVRAGAAYVEITEAARSLKADLIVIATHGYTGMKHALVGSTTERVVRHAPCPVLVVRGAEE
jgi:nucleotide-binding universal stress UspA family protein